MAELKKIWDNYKEIAEVQKSDSIKLVVSSAIRDGVKYINIREFYKRKRDEVWMPGRDGITVPLMVPVESGTKRINVYVPFAEALRKAAAALETMELSDEAHAVYYTPKEK